MRIDREKYLGHIIDEDKLIIMKRLMDQMEKSIYDHKVEYTDFMDPYERYLSKSVLNRFDDIDFIEDGVFDDCERKIMTIFPDYLNAQDIESELSLLRIDGNLDGLSHKDYLGSILGLGIKRTKIGDILVYGKFTVVVLKKEISDYVLMNLERIGNTKVKISEINSDGLELPELKYKEVSFFVSSLRLDAILSSLFNMSRQESINIIKSGNVKVNWENIIKASKELNVGDIISCKGYGRAIFYSNDGMSKKGRFHIQFRRLI